VSCTSHLPELSDRLQASSEIQTYQPLAIQEAVLFNALVDPGNVRQIEPFRLQIHIQRCEYTAIAVMQEAEQTSSLRNLRIRQDYENEHDKYKALL
jgi:hypothetical protein